MDLDAAIDDMMDKLDWEVTMERAEAYGDEEVVE
jgi:hypothetical protein